MQTPSIAAKSSCCGPAEGRKHEHQNRRGRQPYGRAVQGVAAAMGAGEILEEGNRHKQQRKRRKRGGVHVLVITHERIRVC